ncbi:MAG: AAA family ATPase [Actinobacteria bacterium]|nr:AAA family ATPase [Actinomycetota bacterium]MBI3688300.1 AAA family ATPase [Actinomycetota bacterium]
MTVDQILLGRLDDAALPEIATNLILGAVLGEDEFRATLGGQVPPRPAPPPADEQSPTRVGTYLAGIEVTGFRGIGPTTTLDLHPGPGLTIVTGRNGSGKSSFAEAAEFALTGNNKRWAGRSDVWWKSWRNLHTDEAPAIRIRLGVDGQRQAATIECRWTTGGELTDWSGFLQVTGEPRGSVADLGWERPMELYRPFLSYAELGGLLDGRPSEIHDSLHRILGLDQLVKIDKMLKDARKEMNDQRAMAAADLPALRDMLATHPDPRARQAEDALAGKAADLERLVELATADDRASDRSATPLRQLDVLELPERDVIAADVERLRAALRDIDDLAGTPAEEAKVIAALLRDALQHQQGHPNQPCPVCGGRTLDEEWARQARAELERLTTRATRMDEAHGAERAARRALRERLPVSPGLLDLDLTTDRVHLGELRARWRQWDDLLAAGPGAGAGADDGVTVVAAALPAYDELLTALHPAQVAARHALERRQQRWQPIADRLRGWVETERDSRQAARLYTALQKAIAWLKIVADQVRNDRLAPVVAQATEIWNTLRQESNVDLAGVRLAGTGSQRHVELDVNVDGVPSAALGVMSQGELHSLGLALFLPRATMPESPFRFLVIDDPVQSMDPAKVHGLAQALAVVARDRQVIVFTHDDRLPMAARLLQIPARIVTISRLPGSRVMVASDGNGDPALRYLDDARAITQDEGMAQAARVRIVCGLLRDAIEYACHEVIRRRHLTNGVPLAETERMLAEQHRTRRLLALALGGDGRTDVSDEKLRRLDRSSPQVVTVLNKGVHGTGNIPSLGGLVDYTRRLVDGLRRS